jgi:membrane-anchored protein YejM (alkaline phosphatase superfamily)
MQDFERKRNFKSVFWFLLINFFFSLALNYAYIVFSPDTDGFLGKLFVHLAWVSNVVVLYALLLILIGIPVLLTRKATVLTVISVVLLSLFHTFNILDLIIFHIFRYHINAMVLVLVFTEGARDSLHIGLATVVTFVLSATALVTLEIFLIRFCLNRLSLTAWTGRFVKVFSVATLVFVLSDKTLYAVSDLYNMIDITRCSKIFPLYQRVTVMRTAKKLGFQVDREDRFTHRKSHNSLSYPLSELSYQKKKDLPNIIFILIDAWRFDMLNHDVSPNITEFSKQAVVFRNHYSGGNASRFGVFTLIYGVYGSYWHPFLSERRSPVLLDELMKLGYDFRIITATRLTNPEFRKTAFVKLPDFITDNLPGTMAEERDPELARMFNHWIAHRKSAKPFFAFLFFDAPHGPYRFPKEFEKYKPSNKSPNYVTTGKKDVVPLFNSYRNAIGFDDFLVGSVLAEIKKQGLDRNSIIVITADHGEEFYETGFWGHTSAFSKYQSKVPFIISMPGMKPGEVHALTSHLDVVPTILDALGCTTDPGVYSQGQPLFSGKTRDSVVVAGWDDCAIIDKDYTIVLPLETYNAGMYEVRTSDSYKLIPQEKAVFRQRRPAILEVMKGVSLFLQ